MKQIKSISKASKLTSKNFIAINIIDQQSKIFVLPCGDSIFIAVGATGKFNKTEAREILKHNIAFTALTQHTLGTNVLAQRVLDDIVMKNANPRLRAAFIDGMSANVAAVKATKGYVAGLEDVGKESIVAGRM